MADLTAAREALAEYDRPRCEALLGVDRPTGSVTYQCCRAAGHDESISHDFGPRFTGVHVELLRAALAEVDRLTAELAEARAELENEHGKGDGPSFGWACRGGEWEKTEDDYLSVRRLDTYSVRWEVWRLDECIAAGSAETFRAGMRAADLAASKESP